MVDLLTIDFSFYHNTARSTYNRASRFFSLVHATSDYLTMSLGAPLLSQCVFASTRLRFLFSCFRPDTGTISEPWPSFRATPAALDTPTLTAHTYMALSQLPQSPQTVHILLAPLIGSG